MSRDFRRLKKEANILEVLYALGYSEGGDGPKSIRKMGQNYFIHCPVPTHNDRHMSCRCKRGWSNLLCESCRETIYGIDLIMYETGCSELEAADRLWEIEGRPSWYKTIEKKKGPKRLTLTWEEQNLIGFHLPSRVAVPESIYDSKPRDLGKDQVVDAKLSYYDTNMEYHYIVCREERSEISDFMDDKTYATLVLNRSIIMKNKLIKLYRGVEQQIQCCPDNGLWQKELEDLKKKLLQLQSIIDRAKAVLREKVR